MTEPPEGVLTGDTVPRENEADGIEEQQINEITKKLRLRGEPWLSMNESERRDKARDILEGNL